MKLALTNIAVTNTLRQLGLPGLIGIMLCVGAAWVWASWLPLQREDLAGIEHRADASRQRMIDQAFSADAGTSTSAVQRASSSWLTLWSALPPVTEGATSKGVALQAEVLSKAKAAGIAVQSVQYRGAPDGPGGLPGVWRQRMTIPVTGSYGAFRAWLSALLQQPALSIDAVEISRANVLGDTITGQVSLSLWWRSAASDKAVRP